jgi:hypothetical protein
MAKNSTVTNVDPGDDAVASWADLVKASAEAPFADKKVYTETYASSKTIDLDNGSIQNIDLTGDITVGLTNQELGRAFVLIFKHDGTSRTINLFSTIKWAYGYTPISSQPNKYDVFMFIPIAYTDTPSPAWTYLGFVVSQEQ